MCSQPDAKSPLLPPKLITQRLILRPPTVADAEWIFRGYAGDSESVRYLTFRPHANASTVRTFLEELLAAHDAGERVRFAYVLALRDAEEGAPGVGMIDLHWDGPSSLGASLGYVLATPHRGKGYMTEAGRALVEAALATEALWRVWAVADTENVASHRTLERIGMSYEGTLRRFIVHPNVQSTPRDVYLYARVRSS